VWPRAKGVPGERGSGFGLGEAKGRDDLAANPGGVGFVGDSFYDEPEQGEAVVRVFKPGVAVKNRRLGKVGEELGPIEEGAKACKLVAGATVAGEAGGVRHDLGKGGLGHVIVQTGDEGADGVVEFQPAPFPEEHEACGGEAFRVGRDAEAVARGKQLAGGEVGGTDGVLEHEFAFMHDGEETPDLLWVAKLIVDPGRDVGSGPLQPVFHQILPS
jgi:hypothetical protein